MHILYVTVDAQIRASPHVTCLRLPQWRLFGKEGILHLSFRKTRQQSACSKFAAFLSKKGLVIPLSTSRKCCEQLIMHEKKMEKYRHTMKLNRKPKELGS